MDQQLEKRWNCIKRETLSRHSLYTSRSSNKKNHLSSSFLNASSIWRSQEKQEVSIACLERGLNLYPLEAGLWNNLGNCHLDTNNTTLAISNYRRALALQADFVDSRISLASCLRELGHVHLAYTTLKDRYRPEISDNERQRLLIPLVEALLALSDQYEEAFQPHDLEAFSKLVENEVHKQVGTNDPIRAGLVLTQLWLQVGQLDRALASRAKLTIDTNSFLKTPEKNILNSKVLFKFNGTY